MSIMTYFNKLLALWNELEAALQQYKDIKEGKKVTRFLLILNDTYLPFWSQILAMHPIPSLERIYQLTIQEESQSLTSSEHTKGRESISLAVSRESTSRETRRADPASKTHGQSGRWRALRFDDESKTLKSYEADGLDHVQRLDSSRLSLPMPGSDGKWMTKPSNGQFFATSSKNYGQNSKGKGKLCCDYCKRPHHTIDNYWKLHGKPEEKRKKEKDFSIAYQVTGPTGPNADKINQPISYEQYQQLMKALQKLDTSDKVGSFLGFSYCLINFVSSMDNWFKC